MQDGALLGMSTRWHIGAKELRGAITAYAKRFNLLEVRLTVGSPAGADDAAPLPALATLRRWRKSVPPAFVFAVVAGPNLSRIKPSDLGERELDAARSAIDALQARCFVLRTPSEVTPAPLWRDRIAKVLDRLPRDATHVVWEPSGVWEAADAAAQAKSWGVVVAVDPAREPVAPGPIAYVRLRALGETRSFGPIALERVVRAVGERREVFCVVETESALVEAKRLRHLARAMKGVARSGGTGRVIRPRGGIVVRDDEQE